VARDTITEQHLEHDSEDDDEEAEAHKDDDGPRPRGGAAPQGDDVGDDGRDEHEQNGVGRLDRRGRHPAGPRPPRDGVQRATCVSVASRGHAVDRLRHRAALAPARTAIAATTAPSSMSFPVLPPFVSAAGVGEVLAPASAHTAA
jgi:hypothetical protein